MSRFYVTTPIYYVNDVPHLGTAYTTVVADALRRFHRVVGDETYFLTGTDEHGLKIERAASEKGVSPKQFVDEVSARFRAAWPKLDVEFDQFIRTTDATHKAFVQDLWRRIRERGYLEKGTYEDWYCVGCESFKTEKELLPGNVCPLHQKPAERVKEETYFFRLSHFQTKLLELYEARPELIQPAARRNEVVSFVQSGLRDLSVSRTSFAWGIPVPDDEAHVMYVWFDALSNYRSALSTPELSRFWAPEAEVVHLVGKDILRFHAVYWPAFLLAAGYGLDELPTTIFAHGFLTVDGQKMSKSLRNAVDPLRLAHELGPDVLRYYLLRAVAFGQDGDFDHAGLIERYNADLGKNLGNLLSRTLGLCTKLAGGVVPAFGEASALEDELFAGVSAELAHAKKAWRAFEPHRALEATLAACSLANQYVDRAAPWATVKTDEPRAHTQLAALLEVLAMVSVALWPAMPAKADAMRAQLGLGPIAPELGRDLWPSGPVRRARGEALAPSGPLFLTIDKDRERELLERLVPRPESSDAPTVPQPSMGEVSAVPPTAQSPSAATEASAPSEIGYDDFAKVELRVGLVRAAERVPKKDKLLKLEVDLGEAAGPRTIVAGLALTFAPEALVGRRVVVVANLAPRSFGKGLVSHGMLLATGPSEALHLATIGDEVAPGSPLK